MDNKILKREAGFYWVKIIVRNDPNTKFRWVVAEYDGFFWHYQGCRYESGNFQEIDERRIKR
jgi:hypothetical protein